MTIKTGARASGLTLPELLIALAVLAIVGHSLTRLLLSQSRFFSKQGALRSARSVSRSAANVIFSDLRMVEASIGVIAASPTAVIMRVPYALGVVCDSATVSLLPVDSTMSTGDGFSGYAWRDSGGSYTPVEVGTATGAGDPASCAAAGVTTLPGGRVVSLLPALPPAARVGSDVLLFRQIAYEFKSSAALPGRIALWRTTLTDGVAEELVAPFDTDVRFGFYVLDRDTAQSAVPAQLGSIRGLELRLMASSEFTPQGSLWPQRVPMPTAVFFQNRAQ